MSDLVVKVLGKKPEGKDEISDVMAAFSHYMTITENSKFLSEFDFSKLSYVYQAFSDLTSRLQGPMSEEDATVFQEKAETISTFGVVLEQLGSIMRPAVQNGLNGIDEHAEIPELHEQSVQLGKDFELISSVNRPKVQDLLDAGVSFFPEGARKNARSFLTNILRAEARNCKSVEEFDSKVESLVKKYSKLLSEKKGIPELMDETGYSKANLQKFAGTLFNGDVPPLKTDFVGEKDRFDEDGFHPTFKVDIPRNFVTNFNDTSFVDIEKEQCFDVFKRDLEDSGVPSSFNKFVSYYLMQAGFGLFLSNNIALKNENSLNPNLPPQDELIANNLLPVCTDIGHSVKVEKGIMTITSNITFDGDLQEKNLFPEKMENSGRFPMHKLSFAVKIDLTQGVDQDGYPKSISYDPDHSAV